MKKVLGPKKFLVNSKQNSRSTAKLSDLNFDEWWTDGMKILPDGTLNEHCSKFYLHVPHKDDGTVHRVYCTRMGASTRLMMKKGKLYWLVDNT
jgi:hypothetical protein